MTRLILVLAALLAGCAGTDLYRPAATPYEIVLDEPVPAFAEADNPCVLRALWLADKLDLPAMFVVFGPVGQVGYHAQLAIGVLEGRKILDAVQWAQWAGRTVGEGMIYRAMMPVSCRVGGRRVIVGRGYDDHFRPADYTTPEKVKERLFDAAKPQS